MNSVRLTRRYIEIAQRGSMDDRRLPPHTRRALAALWRAIDRSEYDQRRGIHEDDAKCVLADLDDDENGAASDPLPADEIDYRLESLQNNGEIYYVDGWVRITDPEAVAAQFVNDADETGADSDRRERR